MTNKFIEELNKNEFYFPTEFLDVIKVLDFGIKKGYEPNGWLTDSNSKTCSFKDMHASMFRHLAESHSQGYYGNEFVNLFEKTSEISRCDRESGLDPLLHLACRALMLYTRLQRGIKHETD